MDINIGKTWNLYIYRISHIFPKACLYEYTYILRFFCETQRNNRIKSTKTRRHRRNHNFSNSRYWQKYKYTLLIESDHRCESSISCITLLMSGYQSPKDSKWTFCQICINQLESFQFQHVNMKTIILCKYFQNCKYLAYRSSNGSLQARHCVMT